MTLAVDLQATLPIPLALSFRVAPGELLALVGHSGSGKTTTLRTIAGLWHPHAARVTVAGNTWLDTAHGVNRPTHRRRVGMVFQSHALFPHMSARDNVAAAIDYLPRSERGREADRLLRLVQLDGFGQRRPAALSGGQAQRVAVARALARRPEVLLLDEPFSAVDRATREQLYQQILALREHLSMPVLLVTHDMQEAQLLADRMLVMAQGQMLAEGSTAQVMSNPVALKGMGLRELATLLPVEVVAHEADGMTRLRCAAGDLWLPWQESAPGTRLRLRILAHEVLLSRAAPTGLSAQNVLPARVLSLRQGEGPELVVCLDVGGDEILARITSRAQTTLRLAESDTVHAILKAMTVARDQVAAPIRRAPEV